MASKRKKPLKEPVERHSGSVAKSERRKQVKSSRKRLKRNRQPKSPRRTNWAPGDFDTWTEDYDQFERIMPLDEGERRRAVEQMAYDVQAEKADDSEIVSNAEETRRGLVLEVSTGMCRVDLGERTLLCQIRGALTAHESLYTNVVAVGDEVLVQEESAHSGIVKAVLPRRSVLSRPDVFYSHRQQVIVANVDQVLVVSSWRDPIIWLELIDRYLITAMRRQLPAIICVNKIDLAADDNEAEDTLAPYRALEYPIVLTSALTGTGLDDLHKRLQDKVTVLAGLSGVGKSSLLTAMRPDLNLRTSVVSEREGDRGGEGRHTTTQATLLRLDASTTVVDTPGIREFGLSGLRRPELAAFFPDIAAFAPACRFNNCVHINEPDCAVRTALAVGSLCRSRYHSYLKIYDSLPQ